MRDDKADTELDIDKDRAWKDLFCASKVLGICVFIMLVIAWVVE